MRLDCVFSLRFENIPQIRESSIGDRHQVGSLLRFGNRHQKLAGKPRVKVPVETEIRRENDFIHAFPVILAAFRIDGRNAEPDFGIRQSLQPEFQHANGKKRLRKKSVASRIPLGSGVVEFFAERRAVGVQPRIDFELGKFPFDRLNRLKRGESGRDEIRGFFGRIAADKQNLG